MTSYVAPDGIRSVGQHIALEVDIFLAKFTENQREIRRKLFQYFLKRETVISGCTSMNDIDLLEIGSYFELPGGNIQLRGGYSSILGPLTAAIPPGRILKGHAVNKITWRHSDPENQKTLVTCDNETEFSADHVICTIPLGVLKAETKTATTTTRNALFQPQLPDYKLASLKRLNFEPVDKIFLEYERPFLDAEIHEIVLLWDDDDPTQNVSERWFKKIYSFTKVLQICTYFVLFHFNIKS